MASEFLGDVQHRATYQTDDASIIIEFSFYPIPLARRGHYTDVVWIVGSVGGIVNSAQRLKRGLEKKLRKRYDLQNQPFAICVSIHDASCSLYQVTQALFGNERIRVDVGKIGRATDGFFGPSSSGSTWRHQEVSAVLVFRNWSHADIDANGNLLCILVS